MIGKFSITRWFGASVKNGRYRVFDYGNGEGRNMSNEITLERIKDLILEAYAQVDLLKREELLVKAESLEEQLLALYRKKGLSLTATNIAHSLKAHRKIQRKRS